VRDRTGRETFDANGFPPMSDRAARIPGFNQAPAEVDADKAWRKRSLGENKRPPVWVRISGSLFAPVLHVRSLVGRPPAEVLTETSRFVLKLESGRADSD